MGKRELVLILGFIVLGTVLYQATAPPSPDGRGFSFRGMLDNIRREVGPRHEYLADERTQKLPVSAGITEIRVAGAQDLTVEGTNAAEATAKLQVYSTGLDEKEARDLGRRTVLRADTSGDLLALEVTYPREGRQRTTMTLSIPRRLRVRISRAASIQARHLAGVELDSTRGEARLISPGVVRGTHNGGELTIEDAGDVDLTARRADVTLTRLAGNVRLDLSGGQVTARDIAGSMEIDANRTSIEIDRLRGRLTADLIQGSLEVTALADQARIDARGAELRVSLAKAVPVRAATTDETISIELPAGAGFVLDATAEDGQLRLPEGAPAPSTLESMQRVQGPLRGGGPTLTLRTTHGDIVIR